MDYSKLTENERVNALLYHHLITNNILPHNWLSLLQNILIIPGEAVAPELIDLYIADSLVKQNIVIPTELNMDLITPEYYTQLAPVIYLPLEYTQENIDRAKRIIRIIRAIQADKNIITTFQPTSVITTRNIPIVTAIPKIIPNNLQAYQLGNEIAICGSKTYNLRGELKRLGGRYDGRLKCWKYPLNISPEVMNLIASNVVEPVQTTNVPEVEAEFIPNIERLSPAVRNAARTYSERLTLRDQMWKLDCDELRHWDGVFKIVKRVDPFTDRYGRPYKQPIAINVATITYTGDIKPPDMAFACFLNRWQAPTFGYSVKKVGNRLYETDIFHD